MTTIDSIQSSGLWLSLSLSRNGWSWELHRSSRCDDDKPRFSGSGCESPEAARAEGQQWAWQHGFSVDGVPPPFAASTPGAWWLADGKPRLPCDKELIGKIAWLAGHRACREHDAELLRFLQGELRAFAARREAGNEPWLNCDEMLGRIAAALDGTEVPA